MRIIWRIYMAYVCIYGRRTRVTKAPEKIQFSRRARSLRLFKTRYVLVRASTTTMMMIIWMVVACVARTRARVNVNFVGDFFRWSVCKTSCA